MLFAYGLTKEVVKYCIVMILSLPAQEMSSYWGAKEKHPLAQPLSTDSVISSNNPPTIHPVIFDVLDARVIRSAALCTFGFGGPSGTDACCWRQLCTCSKRSSDDLCHSLAKLARRLCTEYVHPAGLSFFLSCRLIALNKNPGVRPVGVCETMRRIVAKAALMIIRQDILEVSGSAQLCAGQLAGVEAAVHAVRLLFCDESSAGVLLVDTSNAFNSLNRTTTLHNILHLCPAFASLAINCYRHPSSLFASGTSLLSEEGTTQGDPLAMPLYALVIIPLINALTLSNDTKQVWYADDCAATGSIMGIWQWLDSLVHISPSYGYYVNVEKTWLVVRPQYLQDAVSAFSDTKVNITSEGRRLPTGLRPIHY